MAKPKELEALREGASLGETPESKGVDQPDPRQSPDLSLIHISEPTRPY